MSSEFLQVVVDRHISVVVRRYRGYVLFPWMELIDPRAVLENHHKSVVLLGAQVVLAESRHVEYGLIRSIQPRQ